MDFSLWRDILYSDYRWILDVPLDKPLPDIVRQIIESHDGDDIYQSSIVAVGMAYLDYKEKTRVLSRNEHYYARTRGGILGMSLSIPNKVVTLREYLEMRDLGFRLFSTPKNLRNPSAA
jgi:hypothetical protein